MWLMDSYINIDYESVSRNPEILVTRWIQEMCQNSCFVKLCSFSIIIYVCSYSHKTFLNAIVFITGGFPCTTNSQGCNSVTEFTKKCQRQSQATVPPLTLRPCAVTFGSLKITLFILQCKKWRDDVNCAIVLAWFKHILVFTHVDVIP